MIEVGLLDAAQMVLFVVCRVGKCNWHVLIRVFEQSYQKIVVTW